MGNGVKEMLRNRPTRLARALARCARAGYVAPLAMCAVVQAVLQAVALGGQRPAAGSAPATLAAEYMLPLGLLALLATVPLAFYRPATAAVAVSFGNAIALGSFGQLTAGGAIAEILAAWWLGSASGLNGRLVHRQGGPGGHGDPGGRLAVPVHYLAVGLGLPFLGIALATGGWAAMLLGWGVPAAAALGIADRAVRLAQTGTAAGQVLADTVLAHTARGERARIARELHDVVAHHISMIAVLAETGRLTTPGLPEAGARRFGEIGDTARAGLTEMRRLLGVLREDAAAAEGAVPDGSVPDGSVPDGAVADDIVSPGTTGGTRAGGSRKAIAVGGDGIAGRRASRQPQPGIAELTGLVDAARDAAGTGIRLIVSGPVVPLGPGVELAAYRITQEALTNARRHAKGAAVDVELRYSPGGLRLRIRDNGPGPGGGGTGGEGTGGEAGSGGHGLAGMRERAFSVGGSLYTGVEPGGGFLVEAALPTERAAERRPAVARGGDACGFGADEAAEADGISDAEASGAGPGTGPGIARTGSTGTGPRDAATGAGR